MKIGILTFHCARNYGAVLQCYALQETLKKMGHEVEVIDYRPDYIYNKNIINHARLSYGSIFQRTKSLISELLTYPRKLYKYHAFSKFMYKYLQLSNHNSTYDYISPYYDIYIFGSDQIWNSRITRTLNTPYCGFLGFPKKNKKYITYAASMENSIIGNELAFKKLLRNYDYISVREKQTIELLSGLSNKEIKLVLDPTLILNKEEWLNIAKRPKIKHKYVIVYQVRVDEYTIKIANEIAKQIGAIVINLQNWIDNSHKKNTYKCVTPQQFLGWIKYSSCVVTTSFHGTAFSIIFEKPFYTIKLPDNKNRRSQNLLDLLNLDQRLIEYKSIPKFSDIDYSIVNNNLEKLKKESLDFLIKALK